jgi:hypothetical protein
VSSFSLVAIQARGMLKADVIKNQGRVLVDCELDREFDVIVWGASGKAGMFDITPLGRHPFNPDLRVS